MKFKKFTWNWLSILIGFHYGRNPVNGQRFLHIGLGPFLGIDFYWPEDQEGDRPLGVALNDANPGDTVRVQMYGEGVTGRTMSSQEAEQVWKQMVDDSAKSMFRSGELSAGDVQLIDLAGLVSTEPRHDVSHEKADWIAQRILGNIDPRPGESPEAYDRRCKDAEARFRIKYPNWKG